MSNFLSANSPIDADDLEVLTYQLGRIPRGVIAILQRCDKGYPQVTQNAPMVSARTPFPTIYWLTCPLLNKKIAILENQGWINEFQEQIDRDRSFQRVFMESQKAYLKTRKRMIATVDDVPNYAQEVLTEAGIGGVTDLSRVKCLHAHYAHYLASGENPIGQKIDALIDRTVCEVKCEAG